MGSRSYSFLDAAALPAVGPRLAAGDALVVLDASLSVVLWANGAGARLLGATDLLGFIGADPGLRGPVRRQIEATSGFPRIGRDRNLLLRLAGGLFSRTTAFSASEIEMPDGEAAILLAAKPARAAPASAIEGLSGEGQFAALIDGAGNVVAAAEGFSSLGIGPATLAAIAGEVRGESDRTVKRPLRGAAGSMPAGIALLRDEPPLSLLVVVEEFEDEAGEPEPLAAASTDGPGETAAASQPEDPALAPEAEMAAGDRETAPAPDAPAESEGEADGEWYFNGDADADEAAASDDEAASPDVSKREPAPADAPAGVPQQAAVEMAAVPVRFVWRTDAEGRFSAISDEFRNAFGEGASDVIGRSFADVSRVFDLDPDREIAGLLERRDTWSGRSVLWPVSGTDLKVPVDLAALPVYGRERNFEGFRGFGVARMGDAVIDPEAIGLGLGGSVVPASDDDSAVPAREEDPFRGEVPALSLSPTPERRDSDKVVRLAERRAPVRDLSAVEQNNFREIGEKLRDAGAAEEGAESEPADELSVVAGEVQSDAASDVSEQAEEGMRTAGDAIAEAEAALTAIFADEADSAQAEDDAAQARDEADLPADEADAVQTAAEFIEPPLGEEAADEETEQGRPDESAALFEPGDRAVEPQSADAAAERGATEDPVEPAAIEDAAAEEGAIDLGAFAASSYDVTSGHEGVRSEDATSGEPAESGGTGEAGVADAGSPDDGGLETPTYVADAVAEAVPGEAGAVLPADEPVAFTSHDERVAQPGAAEPPAYSEGTDEPAPLYETSEAGESAAADVASEDAEAAGIESAEEAVTEAIEQGIGTLSPADELIESASQDAADTDADSAPEAVEAAVATAELVSPDLEAPETETAETGATEAGAPEAGAPEAGAPETGTVENAAPVASDDEPPFEEGVVAAVASDDSAQQPAPLAALAGDFDDLAREDGVTAEAAEGDPEAESAPEYAAESGAEDDYGDAYPPVTGIETAVLSRLPLPIVIHRGDALYYANREFLQITGYESLRELDLAGGLGALFGDPYEQGDERKLRLRTKSGTELPVDAFLQSVAWDGGKALLLSLKPAPESLQSGAGDPGELEARLSELRTIIDTATDGVVLIENDGSIRSISRPAEALFGFEAEDVRGKPFSHLFAMESQRAARDYLASLADNGVASVLNDGREVIGREAQGRFIPLFMTIGRLPREGGYCAVVRDITQFKRAEEELTQARTQAERTSSQKTDFLARVSHEIRTPLNAIIGFSELMLDEKFGPITNERYKDYLRDINRSGNHVLDLVNDLLDISKIEAGQLELDYEAVSLNESLSDAVAMMQPQANRERVIIRSSFASRLPDVVADQRSIRQIALNLLSNAIRYTPAGGQVIISTSYESTGDVLMRVRDTGIGMAAAEIEQALKPFKQINALKRPRGDGTGLGLPLTKAMVEANRARFAIQSTPGEGTLVEITFPSTRVLAH